MKTKMKMKHKGILFLSVLTGLLYNAWILAFWLNPKRVNSTLLSGLGAQDQPYHWVFILTDVGCGVLCLLLALLLFSEIRKMKQPVKVLQKFLLGGIAGFGLSTALAAVSVPKTANFEAGIPNPLTQTVQFAHDALSVLALLFLAAAIFLGFLVYKKKMDGFIVLIFLVTVVFSSLEGLFPGTFGPLGQQINTLVAGIWLVRITWLFLCDFRQGVPEEI